MIKTIIPTIVFPLFILSCGSADNVESSNSHEEQDIEYNSELKSGGMEATEPYLRDDGSEVFPMIDGKEMIVQRIDGDDCSGFSFNNRVEEKDVIDDDTLVQRRGDSLVFTTYGKSEIIFVNSLTEELDWPEDGLNYEYQGLLETIEYWVVFAMGYEYHKTLLIDKFSGKQTETVGLPSVSPDRRFVLVGNADMEAAFTENHLSLYKWTSDDLKLLVKAPLDTKDWSPFEVNWQDDYHFTVKQGRHDESTYDVLFNCASVTIE